VSILGDFAGQRDKLNAIFQANRQAPHEKRLLCAMK
jgi:hypothetical protein